MKSSCLVFLLMSGCFSAVQAAPLFRVGTTPLVDGECNPSGVVVTGRQPVFSWEYASAVSSFSVVISSDNSGAPILWNYAASTTSANSVNDITRVMFNEDGTATAALEPHVTYYWRVTLFEEGVSSAADVNVFCTAPAAVTLTGTPFDLAVDWNNPFNPSRGQVTRFRFVAQDRDRTLRLRIFTLSGELVREWPEQMALKSAWYTVVWDGTTTGGETVARGVYFVSCADPSEKKGVTRKVAIIK